MTDSLGDILGGRTKREPPEIKIIKDFVMAKFNTPVSVAINTNQIVIIVPSSGLATNLRFQLPKLEQLIESKKRLTIRIEG